MNIINSQTVVQILSLFNVEEPSATWRQPAIELERKTVISLPFIGPVVQLYSKVCYANVAGAWLKLPDFRKVSLDEQKFLSRVYRYFRGTGQRSWTISD